MAEYDYKEYARQMRTNAAKDENGIIRCSPELWEQIASIIEKSEEVKHGEWIYHMNDLFPAESTQECSICHEEENLALNNENYCPNCGAKMDGKEDENGIKKQNN